MMARTGDTCGHGMLHVHGGLACPLCGDIVLTVAEVSQLRAAVDAAWDALPSVPHDRKSKSPRSERSRCDPNCRRCALRKALAGVSARAAVRLRG